MPQIGGAAPEFGMRVEIEARPRTALPPEAAAGIDEAMIEQLVRTFYERVRADALLGPVFEARIADWEPHLARMFEFWSSVALQSGRYHGRPMQKHMLLPVDAEHFDRWLALFAQTAEDTTPPPAAARFLELARRIAESLELGIAFHHRVMIPKGGRFRREDGRVSAGADPQGGTSAQRGDSTFPR